MFERYTEKARRVIFFARYEASQFGSTTIETEHLLLGLIREDKNLTNRFLRNHSSIESIRKEIEGRTTAPAHTLYDIVRKLREGAQIEIEAAGERNSMVLRSGRSTFTLQSLPPEDYPVMTGGEFYAAQQADPAIAGIPVVVISADGNVRQKAQPFGGEYLSKPVKIDTILSTVDRICA